MKNSILLLFITLITSQGFCATDSKTNETVLTVTCQDITVNIDEQGYVDIVAEDLIASSDGTIEFTELSQQYFTCAEQGAAIVTLYAYDAQQNASECTSVVTVMDVLAPMVACQDVTVQLDGNGSAITSADELVSSSFDNCTIESITADRTEFTGADLGPNTVSIVAVDLSGNSTSCLSTVVIMDDQVPNALCQDVTVSLDAVGNTSIIAEMIDNGSFDNSNEVFVTVDQSTFDCGNFGNNVVTLSVLDGSGNMSNCTATVTVLDDVSPTAVCTDINIILSNSGNASISPSDLDNGSWDNCMISTMNISQEAFSADDLGNNTVELTIFDGGKNTVTCISNVHVSAPLKNPLIIEAAFSTASEDELGDPIGQVDDERANEIEMSLYPNPIRNTATTVVLRNMPKGVKEINVIVYDQNGTAIMFEKKIEINTEMKLKLDNFQPFQPGVYMIYVNIDGKVLSQQLVVG